jgi:hypothetical protein
VSTEREDATVLLQRYVQAHELYMSYLNRFFIIAPGRSPTRSGDALTDGALAELSRLYSEEQAAHQAWWDSLLGTRANL